MNLLKQPTTIKKTRFSNRLVMPPMLASLCENGTVTRQLIGFYNERSAGEYIGLVIVEHQA